MTEAQQFDDWLKSNYLFDTSNFIKDEADREKAKATNPTRMAWHHQQQRIDELEKDRDEWKDSTISANCRFEIAENDVYKYQVETANMSLKIFELESKLKIAVDALKEVESNSYQQDIGGGDVGIVTCEALEKVTVALKQIEVK